MAKVNAAGRRKRNLKSRKARAGKTGQNPVVETEDNNGNPDASAPSSVNLSSVNGDETVFDEENDPGRQGGRRKGRVLIAANEPVSVDAPTEPVKTVSKGKGRKLNTGTAGKAQTVDLSPTVEPTIEPANQPTIEPAANQAPAPAPTPAPAPAPSNDVDLEATAVDAPNDDRGIQIPAPELNLSTEASTEEFDDDDPSGVFSVLGEIQQRQEKAKARIRTLINDLDTTKKDLATTRTELDKYKKFAIEAKQKLEAAAANKQFRERELKEANAELKKYKEGYEKQKGIATDLSEKVENLESSNSELTENLDSATTQLDTAEGQLKKVTREKNDFEKKFTDVSSKLDSAETAASDAKSECATAKEEAEKHATENKDLQHRIKKEASQSAKLEAELNRKNRTLKSIEQAVASLKGNPAG